MTSNLFKEHILETIGYVGGSTRSETKASGKVYKLSSNENLLGASPKALKAIKSNLASLHEYNFQDDALFRDAIACSFDYMLGSDQFITANSGMELLDLICRGFLEPGDDCIISTPTFLAYKSFAGLSGGKIIDVPLNSNNFNIDINAILKAVTPRTKLLFVSSPNNPTGAIVTSQEMDALLKSLPAHVIVVYDEVYHHYVDHPGYARALDYIRRESPVIGIHSFSKAFGLAGIRLGYAFSTREIAGYLQQLRRPFMINTLSMEAGIAALGDYEHIQLTTELVEKEKAWLYRELTRLGIEFWPSHANFILFRTPYDAKDFAVDMLQNGIMVRTGDVFGADGMIRVTVGTGEANIAFINALKLLIDERN